MIEKKSIAVDMDNVIADVELHYINWYEKIYGKRYEKYELAGLPETEVFPDKTAVMKFLMTKDFFRTAPLIEGAQEGLKKLMQQYNIYIVSAAMQFPLSLTEKQDWLMEHFPFISWKNIIFCGDKSIINTDYMIDDHIKNLDTFKGRPLLFTANHNVLIKHHTRLNNWVEVLDFFEKERSNF